MKNRPFYRIDFRNPRNIFLLNAQMKDYARVGVELFAQRVVIYAAAFVLAAVYYSWQLAAISLSILIVSETFDFMTFRRTLKLGNRSVDETRTCLRMLQFGTLLSAGNISGFALSIALLQGHTTHFMPLFFLFAAALFAAMNNHQITSILQLRLRSISQRFSLSRFMTSSLPARRLPRSSGRNSLPAFSCCFS